MRRNATQNPPKTLPNDSFLLRGVTLGKGANTLQSRGVATPYMDITDMIYPSSVIRVELLRRDCGRISEERAESPIEAIEEAIPRTKILQPNLEK